MRSPTNPMPIVISTCGSVHASKPPSAELKPKTMPPKPIVERIMEIPSIFGFVMVETF